MGQGTRMYEHTHSVTHTDTHAPPRSPLWLPAIMDRGIRMYERDKGQPAITLWSLGNEAGYGPAHDALAAYLRAKDPTRPVHYEVCVRVCVRVCVCM